MEQKLEIYIDSIIDNFANKEAVILNAFYRGDITKEQFTDSVKKYIKTFKVSKEMQEKIFKGYTDYLWAYDVLEPLIHAKDITDIHCNAWNNIRVKQIVGARTVRTTSGVTFDSPKHFRRFVEHLAIRNKIDLSEQNAQQNFVDKKSSEYFRLRCNITTSFLTCDEEPYLYIRKESKVKRDLAELFADGMFNAETMKVLKEAVKGPVIVSGSSGSGKSVLINGMIEEISHDKSGIILQADDELFSRSHPDIIAFHTVINRNKDSISYTFQELSDNAMYLDRDYIIFSEVKSENASYAFTAALTGHNPWLSLHAPTTRASIHQFGNYVKTKADLSIEDVFRMLGYIPITLIHLHDFRIDEITRMTGWNEDKKELMFEDLL